MGLQFGLNITSLKQPDTGAVIVHRCELCRASIIMWNPWAARPKDGGDLWLYRGFCEDPMHGIMGNYCFKYPFKVKIEGEKK